MITADELNRIRLGLSLYSRKELERTAMMLIDQLSNACSYSIENDNVMEAMARDYKKLLQERDRLKEENIKLTAALKKYMEKNQEQVKDLFGRSTEKTNDLLHSGIDQEDVDEANEEAPGTQGTAGRRDGAGKPAGRKAGPTKKHGKKTPGKRKADLSGIPHEDRFILDICMLDEKYGEGKWRIAFWHKSTRLVYTKPGLYAVDTYTPVISYGTEHMMYSCPAPCALIPGSLASPSIAAEVLFQKFVMSVPLYRQEQYFGYLGYPLSRQTMSSWVTRLAYMVFAPVADYLREQLLSVPYHQCDETTLTVIHDGRRAGAKSYIWVHSTSELLTDNPIVLFCYELTRSTEHLRKFYDDFTGFITCDAYCSYRTLENENKGFISISGCLMHARRRFAEALSLIDKTSMTDEQVLALPEAKALTAIGEVYAAENQLKGLDAARRAERRDAEVRPLVDAYYSFIKSIDTSGPLISSRFKDAVQYSLNQEEYLCRFLEDGNLPVDNGSSERHIRPLAVGRKNFLFCNTIDGAGALAIMYSIVETARANKANIRCYLTYLLEQVPRYLDGTDLGFLPYMMPWSAAYRDYESRSAKGIPPEPEHCVFPRKPESSKKKRLLHGQTQMHIPS